MRLTLHLPIVLALFLILGCQSAAPPQQTVHVPPPELDRAAQPPASRQATMQTAIIGIKPPGTTIEANEMIDWMMFKYEIIHFEFNSYTLSEKAGPILRSKACWIKTQDKSTQIIVTGHCDQRGTEAYNKYLGAMRANAVKQYLVKCGVPFEQVRIVSAGDQHPLVQGQSESDWALNRRVEFQNR